MAQAHPASAVEEHDFFRIPGEANTLLDLEVCLSWHRRLQEMVTCTERDDLLDAMVLDVVYAGLTWCAAFKKEILRANTEGKWPSVKPSAEGGVKGQAVAFVRDSLAGPELAGDQVHWRRSDRTCNEGVDWIAIDLLWGACLNKLAVVEYADLVAH